MYVEHDPVFSPSSLANQHQLAWPLLRTQFRASISSTIPGSVFLLYYYYARSETGGGMIVGNGIDCAQHSVEWKYHSLAHDEQNVARDSTSCYNKMIPRSRQPTFSTLLTDVTLIILYNYFINC